MIEKAQDIRWWKDQWERLSQRHTAEKREFLSKFKGSGVWKERYKTWTKCCLDVPAISPQHANREIAKLIEASDEIRTEGSDTAKADTLATVNAMPDPLADFEADLAASVQPAATEPAKPAPKPAPAAAPKPLEPPKDCMGYPIPQRCLALWNQRDDVQGYLTAASRLKCLMDDLQVGCKGIYLPIQGNVQTHMTNLVTIHYHLSLCKPWAVCPGCDGSGQANGLLNNNKQPCSLCFHTGPVSEKAYSGDWTTGHSKAERETILAERKKQCS